MKIIKALYHDKDVTDIVQSHVKNNSLILQVNNGIFGDPCIGTVKNLTLEVEYNGETNSYITKENSYITLPKTNNTRLGIFYSNNNEDKITPCIIKSLQSIHKATNNKVDIVTNMWRSLGSQNPFIEIIAWTNSSSHLNQILQILQSLYFAQSVGTYEYVSFLEHDVLYPEGYFDYDNFTTSTICNTNYIGLLKSGFQNDHFQQTPLSQMTMKFDFAIKHFESLLPNAILTNNGLVEPHIGITLWNCINPSVHVNHGRHFTSHFSIYSQNTVEKDNYWGDHKEYSNLFF